MVRLPEKWNDWEIIEEIGEGGSGKVYSASRNLLGMEESAAVKIIQIPSEAEKPARWIQKSADEGSLTEYYEHMVHSRIREIKAMIRLRGCRNIVAIYDYAVEKQTDGTWSIFILMELLTSLTDYLVENRPQEEDVIHIGSEICHALIACERENVIHRDIKPDNIFIGEDGTWKLGDFGAVRQLDSRTQSFGITGTYLYVAPEVLHGIEPDTRADLYSLGLVLYHLLNNNRGPFVDIGKGLIPPDERETAIRKRLAGEPLPEPLNGSERLKRVVLKACAPAPEDRYQSAEEMLMALAGDSQGEHASKNSQGKKQYHPLLFAGILTGVAAMFVVLMLQKRANRDFPGTSPQISPSESSHSNIEPVSKENVLPESVVSGISDTSSYMEGLNSPVETAHHDSFTLTGHYNGLPETGLEAAVYIDGEQYVIMQNSVSCRDGNGRITEYDGTYMSVEVDSGKNQNTSETGNPAYGMFEISVHSLPESLEDGSHDVWVVLIVSEEEGNDAREVQVGNAVLNVVT